MDMCLDIGPILAQKGVATGNSLYDKLSAPRIEILQWLWDFKRSGVKTRISAGTRTYNTTTGSNQSRELVPVRCVFILSFTRLVVTDTLENHKLPVPL